MIEYDYPECSYSRRAITGATLSLTESAGLPGTTSVVTGLLKFQQISDYRKKDIEWVHILKARL